MDTAVWHNGKSVTGSPAQLARHLQIPYGNSLTPPYQKPLTYSWLLYITIHPIMSNASSMRSESAILPYVIRGEAGIQEMPPFSISSGFPLLRKRVGMTPSVAESTGYGMRVLMQLYQRRALW